MFFLNNHRIAVQKENAMLTEKGLRPVKVLNDSQLTSCEKSQNTECQSEHNKGMRPGYPQGFPLCANAHRRRTVAEKLKRDAKRQGERVLSDAHGLGW